MTNDLSYSEREIGVPPQTEEEISSSFWQGFVALIKNTTAKGHFAEAFPLECDDGTAIVGSDDKNIGGIMAGEIPNLEWPLNDHELPDSLTVLDAVEFFVRYVSIPNFKRSHDYFHHSHLSEFDRESGLEEYSRWVDRLFRRNRHPFFLEEGIVKRQLPETLQTIVIQDIQSPDQEVNRLLDAAVSKLRDKDFEIRKEALEKLWDAFERLKTLLDSDKKIGVTKLLEKSIRSIELRKVINDEAKALTSIGNDFRIRHSEATKHPIERSIDVDHLFHRMYSLLRLLIRGISD